MMMMGEGVHVSPWPLASSGMDGTTNASSPYNLLAALRHHLPSNDAAAVAAGYDEEEAVAATTAIDDEFRMYELCSLAADALRQCAVRYALGIDHLHNVCMIYRVNKFSV
ncbi:unnamed protein product [Urochloa humidicola]